MAQSLSGLSDVELQNVLDTTGSRKRQRANKRASVGEEILEESGDYSMDPFDEKEKEIDLVSRQNIEVEDKKSVNTDGEVVNSEFASIVESIPTDKKEDKADDENGHTGPMEKLICDDTESGIMVNDNKEDPSMNNEEYGGDRRAVLTSFEHMDSEDHNEGNEDSESIEEHQLVNVEVWYSLSRSCILWIQSHSEVKSHWLTGQHIITTRLWALTIGIEYPWGFFKYMIVLDISTCHMPQELSVVLVESRRVLFVPSHGLILSSGGTAHEMTPDMPCELMPDCCQRKSDHHFYQEAVTPKNEILDVSAVSDVKRREVTCAWKEWMTPVTVLIRDGKMDWKWYLHISENHPLFQTTEFTVRVIPLPPNNYFHIHIPFQGAVPEDDQITHEPEVDARQIGYMTDPLTTIAQTAFEIDSMRLGGPVSLIEQETDQQATYRYGSRMTQIESSRAVCSTGNLPALALPPICSSRSSGQSSLTAGSGFEQESPSRDFCGLWDAPGTQDVCSTRSTGHDHSCSQLTSNDQKEVAALKESEAVYATENQTSVSAHAETNKEPSPRYPQYKDRNARIASFQGWPAELQKKPEEMAECGFYYAGFSDCVHCFHCGVGLRHWMSEDDPWIEHARWSTECIYVLTMKGEEFVSLVKMAVEIAEREEAIRNNGVGNQALQNSNETAPAVPAKEVPNRSGTTNSNAAKDLPGIVGATDNSFKGAVSTQSPGSLEIQKYLLTDAAQSVLDMGYQPKLVLHAIERVLIKMGTVELTGHIIMEALFEIEEEDKLQCKTQLVSLQSAEGDKSSGKGREATGNAQSEESQIDPEKIVGECRKLREATLCKICLENTISVVFLPCGHLVTCSDCAPAMRKCPICKTLIKETVKTCYG